MRFAAITVAAAAALLALAGCGGTAKTAPPALDASAIQRDVDAAVELCDPGEGAPLDRAQVCLERRLLTMVSDSGSVSTALPVVDAAAKRDGGVLADRCHLLMHWVGRNYALEHGVTLATLQQYLPRTNDPGCSAGFAHGLISALGPSLLKGSTSEAAEVCDASPTRYQAYSCVHGLGHAFMRAYMEALLDRMIRPEVVYHHVWRKGDVLVIDNRATMHRAHGDYDRSHSRVLWRIIVEGDRPQGL